MSAIGRKRTLLLPIFEVFQRPLSGKADIKLISSERSANDPLRTYSRRGVVCGFSGDDTILGARCIGTHLGIYSRYSLS